MPYRLFNNYVSQKSFKTYPEEVFRMDMRLGDSFNAPLELRQDTPDPGIFILRQFKWHFTERRKGGNTITRTDVSIVDADEAMVSLTIPPKTLESRFGYRHGLLMKWPSDPETAWDLVAAGTINVIIPQAGLATLSS